MITFLSAYSIDLFALSSKKVLFEDTSQAAQEEKFSFASAVTKTSEPASGIKQNIMGEDQWVMLIYQKGKEQYDQGDYAAATAEWDKLSGVISRYPEFETVIDYLRGRRKNLSTEATSKVDKKLMERKKQIENTFKKGKEFYDQEKMSQAFAEWDKLASFLPEDAPQRRLIQDLKKYFDESEKTRAAAVLNSKDSTEMIRFFASAGELYKTQAIQAKAALSSSENAQKNIDDAFAKAKLLYYQGDYENAMKELGKITPYLPEGTSQRREIETLFQIYSQAKGEKAAAQEALEKKNVKARLPDNLSKFSQEVTEKFKADLKESETYRVSSEKTFQDQQAWASSDFQKGMELYRAGKTDDAILQWEKIAPNFENEKTLRELIGTAKKNQQELKRIQLENQEKISEKQALVNSRLEKGRLLYEAGNMEAAKKEWISLLEFVEDPKPMQDFISQVEKIYLDKAKVQKISEEARVAVTRVRVKTPDNLSGVLASANQMREEQIRKIKEEQAAAEKSTALERQEMVRTSLEKGRSLFDSGKYEEAKKEWASIAGWVEDSKAILDFISKMDVVSQEIIKAESDAQAAKLNIQIKAKTPASLPALHDAARQKLNAVIQKNKEDRLAAEQASIKENEARVLSGLEQGQRFFESGKIEEASKEWTAISSYVEDKDSIVQFVSRMRQIHEQLLAAQADSRQAKSQLGVKVKAPAALSGMTADAQAKLETLLKKLKEDLVSAEAASKKEREIIVAERIEKGRILFDSEKFEEAKKEWMSIASYIENPKDLDDFILKMHFIDAQRQKALRDAQQAKNSISAKVKMPDSLTSLISSAKQKIDSQTDQSKAEVAAAETAIKDRQALVDRIIKSGQQYLNTDRIDEAIKEWEALVPMVQDEASLRGSLESLKADLKENEAAESEAKSAQTRKTSKISTPEDLSKLLVEASRQIRARIESAKSRKISAEQALIDRQAFVDGHFSKGKLFFDKGEYEDALKEWTGIVSDLEEGAKLQTLLDQAVQENQNFVLAQKQALDAEKIKGQKLRTSADLSILLQDTLTKLKSDTEISRNRKESANRSIANLEKLVQNTFDQGKALFDQGKYSEAVKQWTTILSHLQDEDKLRALMFELEKVYADSIAAQNALRDSEEKAKTRLTAPAGLSSLLMDVKQKIQSQTQQAQDKKSAAEKVLADRLNRLDESFAKGKLLFEQGAVSEALSEWAALTPELQNSVDVQQTLDELKRAQEVKNKAVQEAAQADTAKDSKITAPDELEKALHDLVAKLKGETAIAFEKKGQFDQVLEGRKTLVRNTYAKGKALFDEGRYDEALKEWNTILPDLDEEAKLKALLDQANLDYQNLALAQKASVDAQNRKGQKVRAPEGLEELIRQSNEKIRLQTSDAVSARQSAEQELKLRLEEAQKTIQRGNEWYRQGNLEEAKKEWLSISSLLEDPSQMQKNIDELEKLFEESLRNEQIKEDIRKIENQKIKMPGDLVSELEDASQRLSKSKAQAEQEKLKAEQALSARQAKVQAFFDEGKKYYWDGKLSEAIQSWAKIIPLVEESSVKTHLESVTQLYENLLQTQKSSQEAEFKKEGKLKAPDELPRLLNDMKQIVQSQTQYAQTQKKIADQTYVDRQTLINTTFQKGKRLYEEDRIPEALEEWAAIAPYLEKGSEIKQFIENVSRNYENSLAIRKAAEEAEIKKTIKFQTPPDMASYLEQAGNKLKVQAEDSRIQKDAADRSRRDKQLYIDGKFQKGRLLYESGKTEEAVEEWKDIVPYIEDDSKLRQLILKAEENKQKLSQVKADLSELHSASVIVPPDLGKTVMTANLKLEKMARERDREKLEADVKHVIQGKKEDMKKSKVKEPSKINAKASFDEIEQMMLEYQVATPAELEKRHQELKAVK